MSIKSGDLIGFVSTDWKDWIADTINLATGGIPTYSIHHLGIVGCTYDEPLLYESLGCANERPPCCRRGVQTSGCQAHTLTEILATVTDCEIWHYPLRSALYPHEEDRLLSYLESTIGRPYDVLGAIRSGGWSFSAANMLLRNEDTASFFCSEWCVDALVHVGRISTPNVGTWNPNRTVRFGRRTGLIGKPVRLNPLPEDCRA